MTRVCSIFSQILQLIPRVEFEATVRKYRAERHARGFSSWGQFVAMLFCQLGHAKSLRKICGGLATSEGKLRHLGVPTAPSRSTLGYANEHRPWQSYEAVFHQLLGKCQSLVASRTENTRKFGFPSPHCCRLRIANGPNSSSRVFSGCSSRWNLFMRSVSSVRN